jgi:hypothetical protein
LLTGSATFLGGTGGAGVNRRQQTDADLLVHAPETVSFFRVGCRIGKRAYLPGVEKGKGENNEDAIRYPGALRRLSDASGLGDSSAPSRPDS